jgi:pantoate--beta-alanine ligase
MSVEVIDTIARLRVRLSKSRREGRSIGCVPTMGALHAGHGALMDQARGSSEVVVATIFVNPLQFDRRDDYERYARTLEADCRFCEEHGVDVIFAPAAGEMYPEPTATYVEAPEIAQHLCGAFRPGHFRGVATVVAKLFHIVQPDAAYFGEKDAQQLALIQRMVRDLNFPIKIVPVPTVREPDGLALSSRNQRLTAEERRAAPILFQSLRTGQGLIASGERDAAKVKAAALAVIDREPLVKLEYFEAVDEQMRPVDQIQSDVRLAVAAWLGSTRLIDNVLCRVA